MARELAVLTLQAWYSNIPEHHLVTHLTIRWHGKLSGDKTVSQNLEQLQTENSSFKPPSNYNAVHVILLNVKGLKYHIIRIT